MTINSKPQTAEQLLAMLIPDSKPDSLTAARARLAKAQDALDEMTSEGDETSVEYLRMRRGYQAARREVLALETAALKEIRK
jgi:hypothetical protein